MTNKELIQKLLEFPMNWKVERDAFADKNDWEISNVRGAEHFGEESNTIFIG